MSTATVRAKVELWESFPFTYEGREYVSKVRIGSRQLESILNLPAGVFSGMNAAAMRELGISASLTREEILEELKRLNAGSSWAIVELAGE